MTKRKVPQQPATKDPAAAVAAAAKAAEHAEVYEQALHMRHMATEGGGTGGTTSIFRALEKGGEEYLESVATQSIWDEPHEYIRRVWGGGSYRCVLKDSDKRFVPGVENLRYKIAGPRIDPSAAPPVSVDTRKLDELQKQVDAAISKPAGGDTSTADMVKLMLDLTRAQLQEVRNPPAAAHMGNPAEMAVNMMTAIQTAQAPLLAALIERASQPAPDTMKQLKEMFEMFSLMRDLTGDNAKSGGWDTIANKLADPLVGLLGQHVQNQQNGTAPPSTMPQPRVTPNPEAPALPSNRPAWYSFLSPYLPQLLDFSARGRDPITTADFLADGLSDEQLGVVYEHLSRPSFVDELAREVPEVAGNLGWFQSFVTRVLEWIGPPEAPTAPPRPPEASAVAPDDPPA